MKQQESLRRVIAFALMRWHGHTNPDVVDKANGLVKVVFHSWPQVKPQLEALDRTIDWPTVWSSLLQLTADQLFELLNREDLTVDDVTSAGAVSAIKRLWDE